MKQTFKNESGTHVAATELLMSTFREKQVGHDIAKRTRDQLLHKILTSPSQEVFTLIGPTGVGKTVVLKKVQTILTQHYMKEMQEDLSFLPFITVTAVTGMNGSYGWRDGFARLLTAANEPLIGLKRIVPAMTLDGQRLSTTKNLVVDEFRRAFESVVVHRRVKVVFIDEASAMLEETVNRHPLRQLSILKSLAVTLGVAIVLVGAYDLAALRHDGNGQLIRRSTLIHMNRYQLGEIGKAVFVDTARTLAAAAPVQFDADLMEDGQFLLMRSAGCVGILWKWMYLASAYALVYNNGRVTRKIFEEEAMDNTSAIKLACEADFGEALLADSTDDALAKHYGVPSLHSNGDTRKHPTSAKRTVGKRGASRDPVGMTND